MTPVDTRKLVETLARGLRLAETSVGLGKDGNLLEAKGWKEFVESAPDDQSKAFIANMLENYRQAKLANLIETTTTTNVGTWDKFAFPMITVVSENLVAPKLFTTQALDGPSGLLFFANYVTGKAKGNVPRGAPIWDALVGHADRYSDSGDRVTEETLGVSDSNDIQGATAYTPVLAGTMVLTAGANVFRDGGDGVLYNAANSAVGTIDYATGEISGSNSGFGNGVAVTASYNYHPELEPDSQLVNLELQSRPIRADERRLRSRWTMQAAQALQALHKVDAENMIAPAITNHLHWEIDRELIEDVRRQAGAGIFSWSAAIPQGSYVSITEHKLSFIDALTGASSFIMRATNRARANWGLLGMQATNIAETLGNFEADSDSAEVEGAHELGKMGRLNLFCDPRYPVDEALLGHKPKDFVRVGYVFAPWLTLYQTPTVMLDDFVNMKGFASSYGKSMVNNKMYSKIKLSNVPTAFGEF